MKPFYVIADADLLKDITVKHFDKFANRLVSDHTIYRLHVIGDNACGTCPFVYRTEYS